MGTLELDLESVFFSSENGVDKMADLTIVLGILITNYKEALVYFSLAVIGGLLIFSSCLLGEFLSQKLVAPPQVLFPHHQYFPQPSGSDRFAKMNTMNRMNSLPSPWTVGEQALNENLRTEKREKNVKM